MVNSGYEVKVSMVNSGYEFKLSMVKCGCEVRLSLVSTIDWAGYSSGYLANLRAARQLISKLDANLSN